MIHYVSGAGKIICEYLINYGLNYIINDFSKSLGLGKTVFYLKTSRHYQTKTNLKREKNLIRT